MSEKILIVDDEIDIGQLLSKFLDKNGYSTEYASNGKKGLEKAKKTTYDLVLCDFRLPDMDGLEAIQKFKAILPNIKIIIITGYSDIKTAVKCMKSGASEYVTKPIYPEEILMSVKKALNEKDSNNNQKKKSTDNTITQTSEKEFISGKSANAKRLEQVIKLLAPTNMSVIIQGESGTGKEMVANAIHQKSERNEKPFVAIDCGALPKELAASELFGHIKGSFTGAINNKTGHFQMAEGGTLFLDEIGNLSYDNQVKLLRVLQERKIRKIGDSKDIPIDVRLIAASNEDLEELTKKGEFREDLFYRINEFMVDIAPLRERREDIMLFANHFLNKANEDLKRSVEGYSEEAEQILINHKWDGNLRELKNVIKRAVLLSPGNMLEKEALPVEISQPKFQATTESEEITDLKSVAEKAERKAIIKVLEQTGYNKTKTAKILKIDRKTLYNKLESYNIEFKRSYQ
ncbi:MAG: sigma-54 dependent transcriptional regulator [Vicingaceae bacterium]